MTKPTVRWRARGTSWQISVSWLSGVLFTGVPTEEQIVNTIFEGRTFDHWAMSGPHIYE